MASVPSIHGNRATVSASDVLEALGNSLGEIKATDRLTYGDLGLELGKSDDVAASYRAATSDMPVTAFFRGLGKWGPRFAGSALAKLGWKLSPLETAAPDGTTFACGLTGTAHGVLQADKDRIWTVEEAKALLPGVDAVANDAHAFADHLRSIIAKGAA